MENIPREAISEIIQILIRNEGIKEIEFDDPVSKLHIKVVKQDKNVG